MKFLQNLLKHKILLIAACLLFLNPLYSQKNTEVQLASSLFRSGQYEQALELYLKYYRDGNSGFQIINGIKKCFEKLNRFEEMISFFQNAAKNDPRQTSHKITLGRAYYLNSQKEKAWEVWQDVLESTPLQSTNYRLLGIDLVELNLYREAVDIYKTAVQKFKKQGSLYREIGRLYQALLEYENSAFYYLKYYKNFRKQNGYVESRIIGMTKDKEAAGLLIKGIKKFKQSESTDAVIEEIEASLYIHLRRFPQAFEIYKRLYAGSPKEPFLVRFANKAAENEAYDYALSAYQILLKSQRDKSKRAFYFLQMSRINFKLGLIYAAKDSSDVSQEKVKLALNYLNKIGPDKIKEDIIISGLELQADIHLNYYKDTDLAIQLYSRALQKSRNDQTADRIRLKLAEAWLEKNDLKTAGEIYRRVKSKTYAGTAAFRLAELDFYSGQFTKAQKAFDLLLHRTAPEDTVVNNALKQQLLLENFKNDSLNLSKYSKGLLLERQKYYSRAARQFKDIFETKNSLSVKAGMKSAGLYLQLKKDTDAEVILSSLLQQYPKSDPADQALYMLAGLFEQKQEPGDALKLYNKLLIEFPLSFYQSSAREKARALAAQIEENN